MNDWTAAQIKDIVLDIRQTERRYYDDKLNELSSDITRAREDVRSALLIYPTAKDFKELENKVTAEFASRDGKMKTIITVLTMSTLGFGAWISYLTFIGRG